jgi:hypothetical protein
VVCTNGGSVDASIGRDVGAVVPTGVGSGVAPPPATGAAVLTNGGSVEASIPSAVGLTVGTAGSTDPSAVSAAVGAAVAT